MGGLAELFSGAISMGVGGYLSTKAERDNYRYLLSQTRLRVEASCTHALEQEVFAIVEPYGLTSADSKRILESLKRADQNTLGTGDREKGVTSFILKFGKGVETISTWRVYASALTIGLSYFIGGLIPMVWASKTILIPDSIFCYPVSHKSTFYIHRGHSIYSCRFRCSEGLFNRVST